MAPIENDSDLSEDQLQDEQDTSDEEEGSEEGSGDSSDEDQPFPISVNTDESEDEDDSDEDEDDDLEGGESDEESGDEEDDSDNEEDEVKPTKKEKSSKSVVGTEVKQKKKLKEVPQKKVKETNFEIENIGNNANEDPPSNGISSKSLFVKPPMGLVVDGTIEDKIKEFCPLVQRVYVPDFKKPGYFIVHFESFEDCEEGLKVLRGVRVDGRQFSVQVFREKGERISRGLFIKSIPSNASIDELMSHFPTAVYLKFSFAKSQLYNNNASILFRTPQEAVAAKAAAADIEIGGQALDITFDKQELPPRNFARPGPGPGKGSPYRPNPGKWAPHGPRQWSGPANRQQGWSSPGNNPNWTGTKRPHDRSTPQKWWTDTRSTGNAQNQQEETMNGDGQASSKRNVNAEHDFTGVPHKKVKRETEDLITTPQTPKGDTKQSKGDKKEHKLKKVQDATAPQKKKSNFENNQKNSMENKMKKIKGTSQLDSSEKKLKSKKVTLLNDQAPPKSSPAAEDKLAKVLKQVLNKEKIGKNKKHSNENAPNSKQKLNSKKDHGVAAKNLGKKLKVSRD